MGNKKTLAIALRKSRKSYNEISKELSISKSTVSRWLSNEHWSKEIEEELKRRAQKETSKRIQNLAEINRKRWEAWREEFRKEAREEYSEHINKPLFASGISLYWGEGDSKVKNGIVRLANSDHRMIKTFNSFLQNICNVPQDKIALWLLLYPEHEERNCKQFWSKNTGVPINQFRKTQFIKGRHPTKKLENGVCTIFVSSRGLKEKIIVWINMLCQDLIR